MLALERFHNALVMARGGGQMTDPSGLLATSEKADSTMDNLVVALLIE
jgi:hypothetical protein